MRRDSMKRFLSVFFMCVIVFSGFSQRILYPIIGVRPMKKFISVFVVLFSFANAIFADPCRCFFNQQKNELTIYFDDFEWQKGFVMNFFDNKMTSFDYGDVNTKLSDSGKYKVYSSKSIDKLDKCHVYDIAAKKELCEISHCWHYISISPNDELVVLGNDGGGDIGGKSFYNLHTGKFIAHYPLYDYAFFNTSNKIAMLFELGCEIRNLDDDSTVAEIEDENIDYFNAVVALSWSDKYLVMLNKIYDTSTWKQVGKINLSSIEKISRPPCFSRDEKYILFSEEDGVHCYDIFTGLEKYTLNHIDAGGGYGSGVQIFATANGKIVTCSNEEGILKTWDGKTGALLSSVEIKDATNFLLRGKEFYESKNFAKAAEYFSKSEETEAKKLLGDMYYSGIDVKKNLLKAKELYEKAAEGWGDDAYFARNILGNMYRDGYGVNQDYTKAKEWYEKAASGYGKFADSAKNSLGKLYEKGLGVPQDYVKAKELYKSTSWDNEEGKKNLNNLYELGYGITKEEYFTLGNNARNKKDYATARKWYERAAAMGEVNSINWLGVFYHNGWGVERDYVKAREYYEKAVKQNDMYAMCNLGILYEYGLGVEMNKAKAKELYQKAAALGNEGAKKRLQNL